MEEFGKPRLFFPLMLNKFGMFANEVIRRSIIPFVLFLSEIYC